MAVVAAPFCFVVFNRWSAAKRIRPHMSACRLESFGMHRRIERVFGRNPCSSRPSFI